MQETQPDLKMFSEEYKLFGLTPDASDEELRRAYLAKTRQTHFQKVFLENISLVAEFAKYHEYYLRIMKNRNEAQERQQSSPLKRETMFFLFFNQGVSAMIRGDLQLAGEKFYKAQAIDPTDPTLLIYLAIILMRRKNYYAAEKYLNQVLAKTPLREDAWYYLAENYFQAELFKKAIETYEKVRELNPAHQMLALRIKECHEAKQRKIEAEKGPSIIKKALEKLKETFAGD